MKSTITYFDEAKAKLGIESDYGMAAWLGVTRAAVSAYRNNARTIDDFVAAKIAEVLGIDPMVVISAANAEREKDVDKKEFWKNFYERLGGIAATILVAFVTLIVTLGHSSPLQAAPLLDTHSAFADDIHSAKYAKRIYLIKQNNFTRANDIFCAFHTISIGISHDMY